MSTQWLFYIVRAMAPMNRSKVSVIEYLGTGLLKSLLLSKGCRIIIPVI